MSSTQFSISLTEMRLGRNFTLLFSAENSQNITCILAKRWLNYFGELVLCVISF